MEHYKRRILIDMNENQLFNINDIISNLVNRNIFESREIDRSQEFITISELIDLLQEKVDDAFETFVKTLSRTKHQDKIIADIKSQEESERDEAMRIEEEMLKQFHPSKGHHFIFVDVMSELAETLKEENISKLCEHFNIPNTRIETTGLEVVLHLLKEQHVKCTDVDELYTAIQGRPPAKLIKQYRKTLEFKEIILTCRPNHPNATLPLDLHTDLKIFRRLKLLFARKTGAVLCHISKGSFKFNLRIPTIEALNALVNATCSNELSKEIASILSNEHHSLELMLDVDKVNEIRAFLDEKYTTAIPLCLPNNFTWNSLTRKMTVDERSPRKKLTICDEGLKVLKKIGDDLVVVICIAGPARSGKSFFASRILDGVSFELGHKATSHTTGIWIGVGPKPTGDESDQTRVIVLDAEGLDGVTTESSGVDVKWEHKIFSLCVLLSSFFIYNSKGTPNYGEIDKLGFIANFSKSIFHEIEKINIESRGNDFLQFAPDFLWLFRDNLSKAELDGNEVSWTKYVTKTLLAPRDNETERNNIRKSITSTFRNIRAASLPPPTLDRHAVQNLLAPENKDKINGAFIAQLKEQTKEVLGSAQIKQMKGSKITGHEMCEILTNMVQAVNSEGDNLNIATMWNNVVESQLQRYTQIAVDSYMDRMKSVILPANEEEYGKIHTGTKEDVIRQFQQDTLHLAENIPQCQINVIDDKLEEKFKALNEENEHKSLNVNLDLIKKLKVRYLDLFQGSTCTELDIAAQKCIDEYKKNARGPKAEQVMQETKKMRETKRSEIRVSLLEKAVNGSLDSFNDSLKELKGKLLNLRELNKAKTTRFEQALQTFEKTGCSSTQCSHCETFKQKLKQELNKIFDTFSHKNYQASKVVCERLIDDLVRTKLETLFGSMELVEYSECLKIKKKILDEYESKAKGLAKEEVRETCNQKLDWKIKEMEVLIIYSALEASHKEVIRALKTPEILPVDRVKGTIEVTVQTIKTSFEKKCHGIADSTLNRFKLDLDHMLNNYKELMMVANQNRSYHVCKDLVSDLSTEFQRECEQFIDKVAVETEVTGCTNILRETKQKREVKITEYNQTAKGTEKTHFLRILTQNIEHRVSFVKNAVKDRNVELCLKQMDEIQSNLPLNEDRMKKEVSTVLSQSTDILSKTLQLKMFEMVNENYLESAKKLESVVEDILLECQHGCSSIVKKNLAVGGAEAVADQYAQVKRDCMRSFEADANGALKYYFQKQLEYKIDKVINASHAGISDNNFKQLLADYRHKAEALLWKGPLDDEELKNNLRQLMQDVNNKVEQLYESDEDVNFTMTEEMLQTSIENIENFLSLRNDALSFKFCEKIRLSLFTDFKLKCMALFSESKDTLTNLEDELCILNDEILHKYDREAIGPKKRSVRNMLENEMDTQSSRLVDKYTSARMNTAKDTFQRLCHQFENDINESAKLDINILSKTLNEEAQKIQRTYPFQDNWSNFQQELNNEIEKFLELTSKRLKAIMYNKTISATKETFRSLCEEFERNIHESRQVNINTLSKRLYEEAKKVAEVYPFQENRLNIESELHTEVNNCLKSSKERFITIIVDKTIRMARNLCDEFESKMNESGEIDINVIAENLREKSQEMLKTYLPQEWMLETEQHVQSELEKCLMFSEERMRRALEQKMIKAKDIFRTCCDKFQDNIESTGQYDLDVLTQNLGTELRTILTQCSARETKSNIRGELKKLHDKVLNSAKQRLCLQLISNAKQRFEKVIKDFKSDILETTELEEEIDEVKQEIVETLQEEYRDSTRWKELVEFMNTEKDYALLDNSERSRSHCRETMTKLLQKNYKSIEKFFVDYYQQGKGPAKKEIWKKYSIKKSYNGTGISIWQWWHSNEYYKEINSAKKAMPNVKVIMATFEK